MNHCTEAGLETPELFLVRLFPLLLEGDLPGPVLDLAAGTCRHGLFVAQAGLPVFCCDRSFTALAEGRRRAARIGVRLDAWVLDLEGCNPPLPPERFGAILVFRYLHRPLMPIIRQSLRPGGLLLYETYTEAQSAFGRPRDPAHLLHPGELKRTFADWKILYSFEGLLPHPQRACAQLAARKPVG